MATGAWCGRLRLVKGKQATSDNGTNRLDNFPNEVLHKTVLGQRRLPKDAAGEVPAGAVLRPADGDPASAGTQSEES